MAWRKVTFLRRIKSALLPAERRPRAILTGPFRGIRMEMSLQSESQIYAGLFERELHPAIRRLSRGVQSVVDIGAAQGEYTLYALLKTDAVRVISIEPESAMIEKLHRNLRLNSVEDNPRLEFCPKYLGVSDGPDTISADSLVERIQAPCFVKMDIEGAEVAVLSGSAQKLLQAPGVRWLIEAHSQELRKGCESILAASGYKTTFIPQAWWRAFLPELRGSEAGWIIATK